MDFQHSERAQKVMAQVQRFVDERIVPNEQTYLDQLVGTNDWREWKIPPILEELKAEAKADKLSPKETRWTLSRILTVPIPHAI